MIDDMQSRNLAPATQHDYILHVAHCADYYGKNPEQLDLEDIRQFHLHLLNDLHCSAEAVNQSVSAVSSSAWKCPGATSISHGRGAGDLLWRRPARVRSRGPESCRHRFPSDAAEGRAGQGTQGTVRARSGRLRRLRRKSGTNTG